MGFVVLVFEKGMLEVEVVKIGLMDFVFEMGVEEV